MKSLKFKVEWTIPIFVLGILFLIVGVQTTIGIFDVFLENLKASPVVLWQLGIVTSLFVICCLILFYLDINTLKSYVSGNQHQKDVAIARLEFALFVMGSPYLIMCYFLPNGAWHMLVFGILGIVLSIPYLYNKRDIWLDRAKAA